MIDYTNTIGRIKPFTAMIFFISLLLSIETSYAGPVSEPNEDPALSFESNEPESDLARELYSSDFDPFEALPLPPAWHETEGYEDTTDVLSQQLATEDHVRVRVDLRLPTVETDRMDETQVENWALDQEDAAAELLASLPSGTYELTDVTLLDSNLHLDVQDDSLKVLMDSSLVANVSIASIALGFTNTRIDPPYQPSNYGGEFGSRVRQSDDVALVHQFVDSYWPAYLYFFRRTNNGWVEEKRENVGQPYTTAIDGDLVAVGKPNAEPTGLTDEGDITVYHWNGSYWNTESISLPIEHRQEGAKLGSSVAISGNTLAVGAPGWDLLNDGYGNAYYNVGRVYIWVRQSDGQWDFPAAIEHQQTPTSLRANNKFGTKVYLSGDTLLVNYIHYINSSSSYDTIDIWDRTNTSWSLNQTIDSSSTIYAAAFDGTLAILGKANNNQVQVWRRAGGKGTSFNLTTTLTAADGSPNNYFGYALALSGNRIIVGAPYDTRGVLSRAGAAYVYRLVGAAWVPEIKVMAEPAYSSDYFGYSVALSGNSLLMGAPGFNGSEDDGTVYTYQLPYLLSIDDVTEAEGNSGDTAFTFTVSLNTVSATDVTVQYATAPGTATIGSDFTTSSGTLTIPAGQLSEQVTILVAGDTAMEADETFNVNLSVPVGATLADSQGRGTITNDDTRSLNINDVTKAEGNSGNTAFTFTVSLDEISSAPVTVKYATANGTGTAGSDYTAASGSLNIPAGQISQPVTIQVAGDTALEANETFYVNLSTPTGATLADTQGQGTISNDDLRNLRINDVATAEGDSGATPLTFTVSLDAISSAPVTVQYATADDTATAGNDFISANGTITIPAGQLNEQVTIQVAGDATMEADETFYVNLSNPSGATLADAQGLGTINNDDLPNLGIDDVTKAEGNSGTTSFTFTVSLDAISSVPVSVQYASANGTATAGSDYTASSGSLTIPAGELFQQVTIQVAGDTAMEANETFYVNLSNSSGATLADNNGLGTITNDDIRSLRINDVRKNEGNSGTIPFTFTVSLNATSSAPVMVKYATANGTATAGSDYTSTSGTLTIPAGQISKTVAINVTGDTTNEANETFYVNLSAPIGATLADTQGLGTISNDDGSKPDFIVTAITLNPPAPAANTSFSATVTVKNQGKTAANGGWLDVYTNQPTTAGCGMDGNKYQPVGTLAAGASKTITFTGLSTRKASGRTFRAYVDSYCQTGEANESNNQLTKSY